jgi:hypothetical protein
LYKSKEKISRPLLTRIIQKRQKDYGSSDILINIDNLNKDSNIRRNHLVLEDIVRLREKEAWLNDTS